MPSASCCNLGQSKISSSGNGLIWASPKLPYKISLANKKTSDYPKFKAFADNKVNVAQMIRVCFEIVGNIKEKGENLVNYLPHIPDY